MPHKTPQERKNYQKHRRQLLKSQGLCVSCGKSPAMHGRVGCSDCADHYKQRSKLLKSQGLCRRCKSIIDKDRSTTYCLECLDKQNQENADRRNKNKCRISGCNMTTNGTNFCSQHRMEGVGKRYNLSLQQLTDLYDKQDGNCPYSGQKLDVNTMHLDHRIPKSKGGSNTIDNLQWIPEEINFMKHKLMEEEFMFWIEKIYEHSFLQKVR